jgi:hypothetical protein
MLKVYVASSWRNVYQPYIVDTLCNAGFRVYDFRHPDASDNGFHWSEIDPHWEVWTRDQYVRGLEHQLAVDGFNKDFEAMKSCGAFVLVCPAGRSAHLEFGWAIGAGRKTAIYMPEPQEPELMYKLADRICVERRGLIDFLRGVG